MIVTMSPEITGREIAQTIGIVRGNVVRARFFGRDILAGFRQIVGGEINENTKLMAEAREQAYDRMVRDAERFGADAIINMRFTTSMIMQGSAEILAYGTAVTLK